jgi:molybdate transport system regulatory protein
MTRPRVRLRIEFAPARWLGPGKVDLLESIGRTGSLTAAAADCGMSYKRAWVLLKAVNEIFSAPLVELSKGGRGGGGGAHVTSAGEAVVAAYRQAEREATTMSGRAFAGLKIAATDPAQPADSKRRRRPNRRRRPREA